MATTNLITRSHGDIVFQHGNGTPDHASPLGSEYVDLDTGLHYTNTGGVSWSSGGGGGGDMLAATYDPTGVAADCFDKANETGVNQVTGTHLSVTITGNVDDFSPVGYATANYFYIDTSNDRDWSGWEAPPAGVDRIVEGNNVSDKKIKFKNNDSGSVAANRMLLKEYGDKDCKKGEYFAFKYDHTASRWRPYARVG